MTLAISYSRASTGIEAPLVTVEVHLSQGLPGFSIAGLPEAAVKESRHRVRSAILNSQFSFPTRRITVNLAPADLPKEGGRFDLAIALGILAASSQIPKDLLTEYEFAGELGLTGELRRIRGVLPFALATIAAKRRLILPEDNAKEAAVCRGGEIYFAKNLLSVCGHLSGVKKLIPPTPVDVNKTEGVHADMSDIKGQIRGKRALEIAAAGGHSILFIGPPGSGKTLLASRIIGILPNLSVSQALEVAGIYSMSKLGFDIKAWRSPPFRSPHHTVSSIALVGGGNPPTPGEVSLSHHGVLFLDELLEFSRRTLETLREPLQEGIITISRASHHLQFPAQFQLVAAMNPCPCGYLGDPDSRCQCTQEQIQRYRAKLSGPLLDRIDLQVDILRQSGSIVISEKPEETSPTIRERVKKARRKQDSRYQLNARLSLAGLQTHCALSDQNKKFLEHVINHLRLSTRSYHRILKLARTIADLGESETIEHEHLAEALSYRTACLLNQEVC